MVLESTLPGTPPIQYTTQLDPVLVLIALCILPEYWWVDIA